MAGHDNMTPEGKKFFKELEELKKLEVRVGFQRGKKCENDEGKELPDIMDIAMWNELGTDRIPSRPFMRKSVDENKERIKDFNEEIVKRFMKGQETVGSMLKKIGNMQKGLIQEKITDGEFEANSEAYVESLRRKSDGKDFNKKPLILTGQMRQSVSFVIQKKGED